MTDSMVTVGTPVRFKDYPKQGIGRYRRGHVIRVKPPGDPGVPEATPTYEVFDQRNAIHRFLKREHFKVVLGKRRAR